MKKTAKYKKHPVKINFDLVGEMCVGEARNRLKDN